MKEVLQKLLNKLEEEKIKVRNLDYVLDDIKNTKPNGQFNTVLLADSKQFNVFYNIRKNKFCLETNCSNQLVTKEWMEQIQYLYMLIEFVNTEL